MKTVEIEISRTEGIRVPISVPDHWDTTHIRKALSGFWNPGTLQSIADEIMYRSYDWDNNGGHLNLDAIHMNPDVYADDDEPVFTFPDEDAPAPAPNPDQLGLLEAV